MLLKFELGEQNLKMNVFTVLLTVGKGVLFHKVRSDLSFKKYN